MGSLKRYLWVVHLFAIAICAFFAAQTVTTYLAMLLEKEAAVAVPIGAVPAQAGGKTLLALADYEVIVDRNIFNSVDAPVEAGPPPDEMEGKTGDDVDLSAKAVKTSLNIKVLGTLVVGEGTDRRSSTTVVGGKQRKPAVYFVRGKESFEKDVTLVRVKRDRIEFVNKGRLEYALLEGIIEEISLFARADQVHFKGKKGKKGLRSEPREREAEREAPPKSGTAMVVDQSEIDEALANLDRLYTEIRIVPNFRDGRPAGLKVLAVKPGSLFSKLGLQRGDVLESINGMELDIKNGMQIFGQLKDQKNLRIDLVRRGKNTTLEYEIR